MKKKKKLKRFFISLFTISLISLTIYNLYIMYKNIDISNEDNYKAERTELSTIYSNNVETSNEKIENTSVILEDLTKTVVGISKLKNAGSSILNNISSNELGLGTGISVSEDGYILSNNHVTGDKYSTCYVTINENTYKGTVLWSNEELDLSITKVQITNLEYAKLGDSKNLKIGEQVFAIGNPIGYQFRRTVTSGIISALNRTIKIDENEETSYISDLIQTDATINPGNSGGPLINTNGEVIGINTVKITSAEGIGFAIPINVVKPIIESFKEKGRFEEPVLGIDGYDGEVAEYLKLKGKKGKGVYVAKIKFNGPTDEIKLEEGDLITKIDEYEIDTINDLRYYVYTKEPGDTVILNILRDEEKKEIEITLKKK